MILKLIDLKFHANLPGANELEKQHSREVVWLETHYVWLHFLISMCQHLRQSPILTLKLGAVVYNSVCQGHAESHGGHLRVPNLSQSVTQRSIPLNPHTGELNADKPETSNKQLKIRIWYAWSGSREAL